MRVLLVLAHPRADSFNAAVANALSEGMGEGGCRVDLADLYAEGFRPGLSAEDLATFETGGIPPDVVRYQDRVRAAQGLAFVFPVWWFGQPAVLKGFFDRVFFEDFAFRFTDGGRVEGLLTHRKALVVNTAGAKEDFYKAFAFDGPLKKTLDEWTLKMCGVKEVEHVIFHDVLNTTDAARKSYLEKARALGRTFFGGCEKT